mgnify:CR=1 FL=1
MIPANSDDDRTLAKRRLPRLMFDYLDGAAGAERTARRNLEAFDRVALRQRVLRDVSALSIDTTVLGRDLSMPVVLAPVGLAGAFATRAEVAAARAAEGSGLVFCESTVSICSIEEVAGATTTPPWFQLYVMRDRSYAESLMARAAAVGVDTLVLTVDLPVVGPRYREVRNGAAGIATTASKVRRAVDIASHPRWVKDVAIGGKPLVFGNLTDAVPTARNPEQFKAWVDAQFDPSVVWSDLEWVRANWSGRLVLKGILDADDARRATDDGADGIVVSNHGGRQLEGAPATIDALPAVVDAVGDRTTVLVDGGVRSGVDVVKALALGADAAVAGLDLAPRARVFGHEPGHELLVGREHVQRAGGFRVSHRDILRSVAVTR